MDGTHENGERRLAIEGGSPVRQEPFPPWPSFAEDEIAAVVDVLRSGRVNQWTGHHVAAFEREFAEFCGTQYAVAVANGTVALEAVFAALGIGPGDDVVVTARSFVASASSAAIRGANVVFADVDRDSQNVTAETIAAVLTPRTKAVVAVHLAGWPCDMEPILELARRRRLWVVEDCAQAHGARYRGRSVGAWGHAAAFSFCQDKIMTTGGEGGMVVTNDPDIYRRVWEYKDHGKSFDALQQDAASGQFRWLHDSIGTNWRMTEMQAAIGRVVLRKLPDWVTRRRRLADRLTAALKGHPAVRVPVPTDMFEHAYYKFYFFVQPGRLLPGWNRDRVIQALLAEGIPCGTGICPEIYLEGAFRRRGSRPVWRLPVAKELGETAVMLQVHPTLGEGDITDMLRALDKVLYHASGIPLDLSASSFDNRPVVFDLPEMTCEEDASPLS
ncbi:DegT/DnrJ/EryC1/StrS aminotransferase family protein [Thermostilla marina]